MSLPSSKKLTYISIFSGIEAASVAWEPLGFEPVVFAEVDPFPSAVLKERYPHVPNLGDITKINWSDYHGKIDIVVGGSPCQSFSIAGKREGLSGESGLMFEYIRAVREIRPRYFVWENVPGALSSEKGQAFRQLLCEMDELGYGLAWRILDAQFFGVAQRRRRVFLVGCLGNPECAAEILFEPESLRWNHPSSRDKRKELASAAGSGAGSSYTMLVRCGKDGGGKGALVQDDVSATLSCANVQTLFQPISSQHAYSFELGAAQREGGHAYKGVSGTLRAHAGDNQMAAAYAVDSVICMASGQANAEVERDMAPAQSARQYKDPQIVCFNSGNANDMAHIGQTQSQVAPSLRANRSGTNGTPVVCMADDNAKASIDFELCGSLKVGGSVPMAADGYIVRRLTPLECERLQGFPDNWTKIAYRGKSVDECSDTPRYKALGNSMAVPVMRWIGERILRIEHFEVQPSYSQADGRRYG